ncbi:MAG: hypothetical protein RL701_2497 [Pseudomonadota bacterium]
MQVKVATSVLSNPESPRSTRAPSNPERYASALKSARAIYDAVSVGNATIQPLAARGSDAADA